MPSNGASRSAEGLAGTPDRPKRFCCHAMTVRGCTNTRIACQPVHSRERQAQNRRSVGRRRGRETVCL